MDISDLFADAFDRVRETVHAVVADLDAERLATRLDPDANPVGWLVWHLSRVQDDHVAAVAGREQVWTASGFADRFGLPFPAGDIGYGHSSEEVAAVRMTDPRLLVDYHDAVYAQTRAYVAGLAPADLDRIVDERWDPPVTLGVRLVSVVNDDLQHAGQAAYVRGILLRRS